MMDETTDNQQQSLRQTAIHQTGDGQPLDPQQHQIQATEAGYQPQGLTVKLLMQGKEVGIIIGKKGDNIKRFRELSGAKINVSDSSCPVRIVTLVGSLSEVFNAVSMICAKFEEQISLGNNGVLSATSGNTNSTVTDPLFGLPSSGILTNAITSETSLGKGGDTLTINNNSLETLNKNLSPDSSSNPSYQQQQQLTLRLIIQASQCGSLIGRGGNKIKEIREKTGATIQVAPDVLPSSTERVVTIGGKVDSVRSCTYQICMIMLESPPKGYTVPYRPRPALNPMLLAAAATAGQAAAAYNLPGQFAALSAHPDVSRLFASNNPLASAFNPNTANLRAAVASSQAAAALSATSSQSIGSHEMTIPNGLIGCVIGKGGSKINEIRQLSGATIKISDSEEGAKNRVVTINGTPDAINLAQFLITASCNGNNTQTSLLESMAKPWIASQKSVRKFTPY